MDPRSRPKACGATLNGQRLSRPTFRGLLQRPAVLGSAGAHRAPGSRLRWTGSSRAACASPSKVPAQVRSSPYIHRHWYGLQTFLRDRRSRSTRNAVENLDPSDCPEQKETRPSRATTKASGPGAASRRLIEIGQTSTGVELFCAYLKATTRSHRERPCPEPHRRPPPLELPAVKAEGPVAAGHRLPNEMTTDDHLLADLSPTGRRRVVRRPASLQLASRRG